MTSITNNGQNLNSLGKVAGQISDDAKSSLHNMTETARRAGEDVKAAAKTEFNNLMSDLQDLASRATKVSGMELAALRKQMSEKLVVAKEKLGSMTEDATAAARQGIDATEKVIQTRPFQAVAVAALAGFAIGMLVCRQRS